MTFGTNNFAFSKSVNYDHKISKLLFVKHYQNVHILHKNIHSTQSLINILLTQKKTNLGISVFVHQKIDFLYLLMRKKIKFVFKLNSQKIDFLDLLMHKKIKFVHFSFF